MIYESPVGNLVLCSDGVCLTRLDYCEETCAGGQKDHSVFSPVIVWLDSYFQNKPAEMKFSIAPSGTSFQKLIWELLLRIPFGETKSYGEIAREAAERLGTERMSAQAVGQAVGRNPISIIIPCHRVIGTNGALTGYAGGIYRKQWLLHHEQRKLEESK